MTNNIKMVVIRTVSFAMVKGRSYLKIYPIVHDSRCRKPTNLGLKMIFFLLKVPRLIRKYLDKNIVFK